MYMYNRPQRLPDLTMPDFFLTQLLKLNQLFIIVLLGLSSF